MSAMALVTLLAASLGASPFEPLEVAPLGGQLGGNVEIPTLGTSDGGTIYRVCSQDSPEKLALIEDGCHPYVRGHALIAEAMLDPVAKLLRSGDAAKRIREGWKAFGSRITDAPVDCEGSSLSTPNKAYDTFPERAGNSWQFGVNPRRSPPGRGD